jgi:hypothetical protein
VRIRKLAIAVAVAASVAMIAPGTALASAGHQAASHTTAAPAGAITVVQTAPFTVLRVDVAALSGAGPAVAAAPPRTSTFSFSNDHIATFNAKLTFLSRYEFEIFSVYLADTACDARSVAATVLSQSTIWVAGYLGGLPYTYKNSEGCHHTTHPDNRIYESKSVVKYVYIALWAGNNNGHSSIAYSKKHDNPF